MKKMMQFFLVTCIVAISMSIQANASPKDVKADVKKYAVSWVIPDTSPQVWISDEAKPANQWTNKEVCSQETTSGVNTVVNNQVNKDIPMNINQHDQAAIFKDKSQPVTKATSDVTGFTSDNSPDQQASKNNDLINPSGAEEAIVAKDVAIVPLK